MYSILSSTAVKIFRKKETLATCLELWSTCPPRIFEVISTCLYPSALKFLWKESLCLYNEHVISGKIAVKLVLLMFEFILPALKKDRGSKNKARLHVWRYKKIDRVIRMFINIYFELVQTLFVAMCLGLAIL